MAIKVTNTTVIDDSRQLQNITNAGDFVKSANFVNPPQIFVDGVSTDTISPDTSIVTDDFSVFGGGSDTHASTDWEVIDNSDNSVHFSSFGDTTNLTSIQITPSLTGNQSYTFRVRHNGTNLGPSEFKELTGTVVNPLLNPEPGDPAAGGFYMGRIFTQGTCYDLIVAPKSTGEAGCQARVNNSGGGPTNTTDGFGNTYNSLTNSTHPAGNWTATRTINGFSDWYLPARNEYGVFYSNGAGGGSAGDGPLGSSDDFEEQQYWTSTHYSNSHRGFCTYYMDRGKACRYFRRKTATRCVRAVRRVPSILD